MEFEMEQQRHGNYAQAPMYAQAQISPVGYQQSQYNYGNQNWMMSSQNQPGFYTQYGQNVRQSNTFDDIVMPPDIASIDSDFKKISALTPFNDQNFGGQLGMYQTSSQYSQQQPVYV